MPFDPALAKVTVRLSQLAYRSSEQAALDAARLGLTNFHWFTNRSTQAFAATDADHLYAAFRGTEANPIDWTQNARFNPMVGEFGGRIHTGFRSGIDEVWEDVLTVAAATGKPVVLTGHSLGGALAVLAAARIQEAGHRVGAVYTFGQPRVGHGDFSFGYSSRLSDVTYRLINHIDLVTRIPLLLQGYRHSGQRVYFDASGAAHIGAGGLRIAMEDLKYRLTHFGRIQAAGLTPHGIAEYARLVEAL
jgi:triacylglycerol lipase